MARREEEEEGAVQLAAPRGERTRRGARAQKKPHTHTQKSGVQGKIK
jgi:hypothetical protein